jgi:hypothetical protein
MELAVSLRPYAAKHWDEHLEELVLAKTTIEDKVLIGVLSLCLAELYVVYGDEPDKAIRIWEHIGTQGSGSAKLDTDIAWTRQWALNKLGMHCLKTALEDETKVERLIPKMERVASLRRHGTRPAYQNKIPPSDMSKYLAFWYRRQGRMEEARQLVWPHIKDAILIFFDDDPSNDGHGFYDLARVFNALGDIENFLAAMHANRRYVAELAVLEGDQKSSNNSEAEDNEQDKNQPTTEEDDSEHDKNQATTEEDDGVDEEDAIGGCDGPSCDGDYLAMWDGMTSCLVCGDYCESNGCYKKLVAGEIPGKTCSEIHDAMYVPVLKTRFKKGETMLGDKVVTLDEWKAGLRRQWGL